MKCYDKRRPYYRYTILQKTILQSGKTLYMIITNNITWYIKYIMSSLIMFNLNIIEPSNDTCYQSLLLEIE